MDHSQSRWRAFKAGLIRHSAPDRIGAGVEGDGLTVIRAELRANAFFQTFELLGRPGWRAGDAGDRRAGVIGSSNCRFGVF